MVRIFRKRKDGKNDTKVVRFCSLTFLHTMAVTPFMGSNGKMRFVYLNLFNF